MEIGNFQIEAREIRQASKRSKISLNKERTRFKTLIYVSYLYYMYPILAIPNLTNIPIADVQTEIVVFVAILGISL